MDSRSSDLIDHLKESILYENSSAPIGISTEECRVFTTHNGMRAASISPDQLKWGCVNDSKQFSMTLNNINSENRSFNDITRSCISSSEKFICRYTENRINVIEIPWKYTRTVSMSHALQRNISFDGDCSISKVLFHPLATNDDTLVILFSDDTICLFDISSRTKLYLNVPHNRLGIDNRVSSIEDIEFSKDGFTLYILNSSEGCDIYALYPCLPKAINLKRDSNEIGTLMKKSIILYESLNDNTPADIKQNVIKQLQFVSKLNKKMSDQAKLTGSPDSLEIDDVLRNAELQGPFSITPFPDELYQTTAKQLFMLDIGQGNELIVVLFKDGNCLILFSDLEKSMCWSTENYDFNNSLVLVERMNFGVGTNIIKSYEKGGEFMVSNEVTTLVNTSSWSSIVSNCIANADLRALTKVIFKSSTKTISNKKNIKYSVQWSCRGARGVAVYNTEGCDINIQSFEDIKRKEGDEQEQTRLELSKPCYKISLPDQMIEIQNLNAEYQKDSRTAFSKIISPSDRQTPLLNESSEVQLEILTDLSNELVGKVLKGQTLGLLLHNRLIDQQYELTRQLQHSNELVNLQEDMKTKLNIHNNQWQGQRKKQQELISRFEKLNLKLAKAQDSEAVKNSEISNSEISWFKEIRNQVLKYNDFVHKQRDIQDEFKFLTKQLSGIQENTAALDKKVHNEWQELRDILERDSQIINRCNEELLAASKSISQ